LGGDPRIEKPGRVKAVLLIQQAEIVVGVVKDHLDGGIRKYPP
jgi:hypothetical protein